MSFGIAPAGASWQEYFNRVNSVKSVFDVSKPKEEKCLHMLCPRCKGSGIQSTGGYCVHAISCPCPKCSVRC